MNVMNFALIDNTAGEYGLATCATTIADEIHSAPEWIELLPAGTFAGRDGRGPFRVSDPDAIIAATDALRMEAGLPIDYDHATDFAAPSGRRAPAAGWIRAIEVRNGALWGKVEWTKHGSAAVVTHEYRYISPVFEYSQDGEVRRVLRAALTNNPNLYLTAISASVPNDDSVTSRVPLQQQSKATVNELHEGEMADNIEKQLCELLGLEVGSTPEVIADEVLKVLGLNASIGQAEEITTEAPAVRPPGAVFGDATGSRTTVHSVVADPTRYVPIEQFESTLTELNQLRAATARERASFRVDAAMKAGKIVPSQREWAIAYCQANICGFESFVARQPALITGVSTGLEGAPDVGRDSARDRDQENIEQRRAGAKLTRTELAVCTKLGLRPRDYMRRRGQRDELTTLALK
jgi:phage I-like protein